MNITLYTSDGKENGTLSLPKSLFGQNINKGLLHEAVLRQQSNARKDRSFAKTRSEVKGGGRKPWKQKGTGRARQGTIRAPQWRGGGSVFGPRGNRNYEKNMPKKMRRVALFSALSSKTAEMIALEEFSSEAPKTKLFSDLLQKMGCTRRTLVVLASRNDILQKSARNIPLTKTITAQYLNPVDLLNADRIVFLKDAITTAEEIFAPKK